MQIATALLALYALVIPSVFAASTDATSLESLYAGRRWAELYNAVQSRNDQVFFRGAVAAVFGDDARAERLLRSVIASVPHSEQAYDAYEWLTHMYFRNGRYRTLMANMEARWAAFPDKPELKKEQTALAGFRDLPDQTVSKRKFSELRHEPKQIFIPLRIGNVSATYFFDTGAWVNCMSASEAKRLGLTVRESHSTLGTATGERIGSRTAVARDLTIGAMHFSNVSFAVFNARRRKRNSQARERAVERPWREELHRQFRHRPPDAGAPSELISVQCVSISRRTDPVYTGRHDCGKPVS